MFSLPIHRKRLGVRRNGRKGVEELTVYGQQRNLKILRHGDEFTIIDQASGHSGKMEDFGRRHRVFSLFRPPLRLLGQLNRVVEYDIATAHDTDQDIPELRPPQPRRSPLTVPSEDLLSLRSAGSPDEERDQEIRIDQITRGPPA